MNKKEKIILILLTPAALLLTGAVIASHVISVMAFMNGDIFLGVLLSATTLAMDASIIMEFI